MATKVPGHSDYQSEPFTVDVTTDGVAIPVLSWPASSGATAFLTVQVPADGQSVALRKVGTETAVTAFPDSPLIKAKRDDAASINLVMHSLPIAAKNVSLVELVGSAAFTAVCQWLPVTEPGD